MSCVIHDKRVCLGRDDFIGACVYCIRQMARDLYRDGRLDFEAFRDVLAATQEVGGDDHDDRLRRLHVALGGRTYG